MIAQLMVRAAVIKERDPTSARVMLEAADRLVELERQLRDLPKEQK